MVPFNVVVEPAALADIQQAIDYYDDKQPGLGKRFESTIDHVAGLLTDNPYYQVRYDAVKCVLLNKYPFMVPFTVDEKEHIVTIIAVFYTFLSVNSWYTRRL